MARKCWYTFVILVLVVVVAFINSTLFQPFSLSIQAVKESRPFVFLMPDPPMERQDPSISATFSTRTSTTHTSEIPVLHRQFAPALEEEAINSHNLSKVATEKTLPTTTTSETEPLSTSPMSSKSETFSTSNGGSEKVSFLPEIKFNKTLSTATTSEEWQSTSALSEAAPTSRPSFQNVNYSSQETQTNSATTPSDELQTPQSTTTLESTSAFETQAVPKTIPTPSTSSKLVSTPSESIISDSTPLSSTTKARHANDVEGDKTSDQSGDGVRGRENSRSAVSTDTVLTDNIQTNRSAPQGNVFNRSVDVSNANVTTVNDIVKNITNDSQVEGQATQIGTNELLGPSEQNGTSEDVAFGDSNQSVSLGNMTNANVGNAALKNVTSEIESLGDVKQNVTNGREVEGAILKNMTNDVGTSGVTSYTKSDNAALQNVTINFKTVDNIQQNVSYTTKFDNVMLKNSTNGTDVKENATIKSLATQDFTDEVEPVNKIKEISSNGVEATNVEKHNVANEQ